MAGTSSASGHDRSSRLISSDANMSAELWIAEGFTQLLRSARDCAAPASSTPMATLQTMNGLAQAITLNPGRQFPIAGGNEPDGAVHRRRSHGGSHELGRQLHLVLPMASAVAMALDLLPRGPQPGARVARRLHARDVAHVRQDERRRRLRRLPYSLDDAQRRLAEASGDSAFAAEFFSKHVHGRDLPDYAALLRPAGILWRRQNAGTPGGETSGYEQRDGMRITVAPLSNTPAFKAGLDLDDVIKAVAGVRVQSADDVAAAIRRSRPRHGRGRTRGSIGLDTNGARHHRRRSADGDGDARAGGPAAHSRTESVSRQLVDPLR